MIKINNLSKIYRPQKNIEVHALRDINLEFENKGLIFILGKSGCGKSTLLNILGGLDNYDSGELTIDGINTSNFSGKNFDEYRNESVGMIFQDFYLLEDMNVKKNIAIAIELQGQKVTAKAISDVLKLVDLVEFEQRKPSQLSGGQKQRIAIARAIVKDPKIILADEPTGNLDSSTSEQIFLLLKNLSVNKLVIVVSHNKDAAILYADRIIELVDGCVISDSLFKNGE